MKTHPRCSLSLVAALASSAGCASLDGVLYGDPAQHVVHVHDRFGGGDSVHVDLGPINLNPNALASRLGARRDEKSDEVWLTMDVRALSSVGWLYARCRSFDLLADDRPVPHGEVLYSMDLQGSWPHETLKVPISVADAKRLASAAKFEGRICQDEFSLSRVPLEWLKAFARALR